MASASLAPESAYRKGNLKLVVWYKALPLNQPGATELCELAEDTAERFDLSGSRPEAKQMLDEFLALIDSTGAQMPTINPDYNPVKGSEIR